METTGYVLIGILVFIGLYLLGSYQKKGYFIRGTAFTCVSGIGSLAIVNLVGGYVGLALPFSVFTAGFCGILGIPGLIALILLKLLWGI